ncbi:uncharacterized protein [Antedon mediterranea]
MNTGKCLCPPGWEGTKCELPCNIGRYGQDCMYECNCINGADCEPVNGDCVCLPGFIGNTCERQCPRGTFGRYCREECDCLNGADCSSVNGICMCEPLGFSGERCEICLPASTTMQCFDYCNAICINGGVCDTIVKQCSCSVGYTGKHCEICDPSIHPNKCIPDCDSTLCANDAMCDTKMRQCDCTNGWTGRSCNSPCDSDYYGIGCSEECNCKGLPCHHVTGQCLNECLVGWGGEDCRQPCLKGTYGYKCAQKCTCQNGAQCNPETGTCLCDAGYQGKDCEEMCRSSRGGINCEQCLCEGPLICHDDYDECVCPAGYSGPTCILPCPEGYYGPSCLNKCNCRGNETCDAVSGKCNCEPGWSGAECEAMCTPGLFGPACSLTCPKCPRLNVCFHVNGSCDVCESGFKGERCNVSCPRGFFGPSCLHTCTCNHGMCNPINGACPLPYSQSPSTIVMNYVLEERDSDFPLFIIISASTLSFLLIFMLIILIGRRIYQKGYKHGSRSKNMNDVVSINSSNGTDRPYNTRTTIQTFTSSGDSGVCEFTTRLHKEGDTPDIIASNSTSCPIDLDDNSYTEVEINMCHSTSSFNEYTYATPPALPAQNTCETPDKPTDSNADFYDEAYSSIERKDSGKIDNSENNCYDFLNEAQTDEPKPMSSQHQYYVLEPMVPENEDDDYDSISDGETDKCLPVPNNYEDITINVSDPSKSFEVSDTYEEVTNPLMRHHTLGPVVKSKKNEYDLLGHSAKRRKRISSEGSKLNGNNSNYGRLQKENKVQDGYNELEFGPKSVRVGKAVFPTGNNYGSLNR